MKSLTGTKNRQIPANPEALRQSPEPERDRLASMSTSFLCRSRLFSNQRGAVISARCLVAMDLSSAQSIFVDMVNLSTAKRGLTHARYLVAQPCSHVGTICVTTTGHTSTVVVERARTENSLLRNSKSFLGQRKRSSLDDSDRNRDSMRRRRRQRSSTLGNQSMSSARGFRFLFQLFRYICIFRTALGKPVICRLRILGATRWQQALG